MSGAQVWNDQSRDSLRETLRWVILGELRLAKRMREEIYEICCETYIEENCPESEWQLFTQYAADEIDRATVEIDSEKASWPDETDCDRLDRAEVVLRERGIILWQVSPCCDTCTVGELGDRIDVIDRLHSGFRDSVRGYAFFIDQNMPEMLADSTKVSIYLGYGWISPDRSDVAAEDYKINALGIAREVCECLRKEGLEADWDGDFGRKIGISLNWRRRGILE